MSDWYYAIDGQQHGPVSNRELHDLAGNGGLHPTDLVWQDGFADWKPASEVAGLFLQPSSQPQMASGDGKANPYAETVVAVDSATSVYRTPDMLKIPLLISAISSCFFATIYVATCFLFFLGIPLGILAFYEIKLYQKTDKIPTTQFAAEAKNLAIYQTIAGVLTGNVPSLICGILLLVKGGEYEYEADSRSLA